MYYINVYIFVEKMRNLIITHDSDLVLNIIEFCLRDIVNK